MTTFQPQKWLPLAYQLEYTSAFAGFDASGEARRAAEEALATWLASHFDKRLLYACVESLLSIILEHFPTGDQPLPPDLGDLLYQPLFCWAEWRFSYYNAPSESDVREISQEVLLFLLSVVHPSWVARHVSAQEQEEQYAYKLVRKYQHDWQGWNQKQRGSLWTAGMCVNGSRSRPVFAPEVCWDYAYSLTEIVELPNMLVFDTYEHACACCERQISRYEERQGVELWKVRVFEPLPVLVKELPETYWIWMQGRSFWKIWQDPEKLAELERRLILHNAPEGTRVCQKLQLVERLHIPPSSAIIRDARELAEEERIWEEELATTSWDAIQETAQEFGHLAFYIPEHQLIILSDTRPTGIIKQFEATPEGMVRARRYAVRLNEQDESVKSFAELRAACLED